MLHGATKRVSLALMGLGLLLAWAFPTQAWEQFEPVRKGQPYRENAVTLHQKGQALLAEKRYDDAVEVYQKAVELNPFSALSANLYNGLGQAELAYSGRLNANGYTKAATEHYGKAVMSYQYAIALQPDFEDHYVGLVKAWEAANRLKLAKDQLRALLNFNPADGWGWYLYAQVEKSLGNYENEMSAMREFVKLQPRSNVKQRWCYYHPEEC